MFGWSTERPCLGGAVNLVGRQGGDTVEGQGMATEGQGKGEERGETMKGERLALFGWSSERQCLGGAVNVIVWME